jgi:hypothetical protein
VGISRRVSELDDHSPATARVIVLSMAAAVIRSALRPR